MADTTQKAWPRHREEPEEPIRQTDRPFARQPYDILTAKPKPKPTEDVIKGRRPPPETKRLDVGTEF